MTDSANRKLTDRLRQAIDNAPQQSMDLIVRVQNADDETQAHLEAAGVSVRYRLTLVPQFIITCPGQAILPLLDEDWLVGIEADGPVHTW